MTNVHKNNVAIEVQNLSKTFYIYEKPHDTLRERFKSFFNPTQNIHIIKALQNVNLKIYKGEFFGIIGSNGSGKSTLLKLIIGAIKPDKGSKIITNGRVLRLALGMGFDYNLSARDNIYVNGSIMGLTFKEIGRRFHSILEFAGLEEFADTPIKFFSSGMISRLAFAISVHIDTDILLIDEFFGGVGDQEFQRKSSEIFTQKIIEGKTVVFISHNNTLIQNFCSRVCLIEKGKCISIGPPEQIIEQYLSLQN